MCDGGFWESFVPGWVCDGGCWESFVPGRVCDGGCGESFVPGWVCDGGCWESFVPGSVCDGGCWESCVPGRAFSDAVGFTVMTSLCSGREKVRPVRSHVNAKAKKFAQRGKNGLKIAVYGVLGEFFRARAQMGLVLGEFFRARAQMGLVLGEFFRATGLICTNARGVFNCLCIRLFV